jgi:hypothetical protein
MALAALATACTSDILLGSRACDPLGSTCACTSTAECPEPFLCMPNANNTTDGTCQPPPNCSVTNAGLSCAQAETCENANTCTVNTSLSCCASDRVCYPPSCLGCCE